MDELTGYRDFVDRRLVEMAAEARKAASDIDSELSAKGLLNSSYRITRQIENVRQHVIAALNLLIGRAGDIRIRPLDTAREVIAPGLRLKLQAFLEDIFWEPPEYLTHNSRIPVIIEAKEELRKLIDGDVSDYRAGIWQPRSNGLSVFNVAPAQSTTINHNTATFNAPIYGSSIQQAGQGSTLQANVEARLDLGRLSAAVGEFETALGRIELDTSAMDELRADLQVIKAQLSKAIPNEGKIKNAVGEVANLVRDLAVGMAGNALTPYATALLVAAGLS